MDLDTAILDCQNNIFATPVWGFYLNSEKYHVSDYIEYINEMCENQPSVKKSNYGGWQSHDDLHKEGIFQELKNSIDHVVNKCVPNTNVESLWANVNNHKDFNMQHNHEGLLSGVFYLKVPENSGNLVLVNPKSKMNHCYYSKTLSQYIPSLKHDFVIKPEPLAVVIFPSWLEHYVEPNLSTSSRISVSFNIEIKK